MSTLLTVPNNDDHQGSAQISNIHKRLCADTEKALSNLQLTTGFFQLCCPAFACDVNVEFQYLLLGSMNHIHPFIDISLEMVWNWKNMFTWATLKIRAHTKTPAVNNRPFS